MSETTITFKLDGDDTSYEVPGIDDLDMDEWQILYEYAGLTLDDFSPPVRDNNGVILDEEAEKARQHRLGQPAFMKALLHVGYQRAHPELKPSQVKAVVGKAKLMSIVEQQLEQVAEILARQAEDPEVPLGSTSESVSESSESSLGSDSKTTSEPATSSRSSEKSSGGQASHPEVIGIGV